MIVIDARNFATSPGALIALLEHYILMKKADREVKIITDKDTKARISKKTPDNNDVIETSTSIDYHKKLRLIRQEAETLTIFCPHAVSFIKNLIFWPTANYIYWIQGLVSEEMRLRSEAAYRINLMSAFERLAYRLATNVIVVSNAMKEFLTKKYHHRRSVHVIPCIPRTSLKATERIKDSFCYVGGMSEWQRLDAALKFFNLYSRINANSTLTIATLETHKAQEKISKHLDKHLIDKTKIISIENELQMSSFLSTMEYGFLLRSPAPLNAVSSPIKFGEYLSCGVSVIISPNIGDYSEMIAKHRTGIIWDESDPPPQKIIRNEARQRALFKEAFDTASYIKLYESI